jgi:hypothetical protein
MPTDREYLKQAQSGHITSIGAVNPIGVVGEAHSVELYIDKASADATAATTTSETFSGAYVPRKALLTQVVFVPTSGGLTANASNFGTVTISKRDAAGANKTSVATLTTTVASSGDLTQGAAKALVLSSTAGALTLSAGSSFTFEIAKTGTGVVVPAGKFVATVEYV